MRDILFRGKRTDNREWVEGRNISAYENPNTKKREFYIVQSGTGFAAMLDESTKNITTIVFANADNCMQKVDPETVGQFTGKTDKNGKKVFEHDILQLFKVWADGTREKAGKVIVQWWEHDQCYVLTTKEGYHCDDFGNLGLPEYYEVIGNIHDNPELLEG